MSLENNIKKLAREIGFDLVGISKLDKSRYKQEVEQWIKKERHGEMKWYEKNLDRRVQPQKHLYNKAQSAITVGLFYRPQEIPVEIKNDPARGIIARYARYQDYHDSMEKMLADFSERIGKLIDDKWQYQIYVDTGPVLEREVGVRGGLGFIGKNTTLINTNLGSYFFLAEIICDLKLKSDQLIDDKIGTCGKCQRCIENCPTQALISPYELDARKCISYLTIENKGAIPIKLRPLMKNRIYGCDICQEVCPWNKKVDSESRLKTKIDSAPYLLDLINLTEQGFKNKFKGLPILRAKRLGFIRNVLVAIGNWRDKQAFTPVLELLNDEKELVRQHAAWALYQIDKSQAQKILKKHIIKEESDVVIKEIELLINYNE